MWRCAGWSGGVEEFIRDSSEGRTVCCHHVGQDRLDLVKGKNSMCEERLEEGAMHVCVALVWRRVANELRVVARHLCLSFAVWTAGCDIVDFVVLV